jgi:hypothetical protein
MTEFDAGQRGDTLDDRRQVLVLDIDRQATLIQGNAHIRGQRLRGSWRCAWHAPRRYRRGQATSPWAWCFALGFDIPLETEAEGKTHYPLQQY